MTDDLNHRRLEQVCPNCARWEAAGSFCSGCHTRTGPDDWYPNGDSEQRHQRAAAAPNQPARKSQTPGKRARGRPRAVSV